MKILFIILILLLSTAHSFANLTNGTIMAQVTTDNVKMYRQAGTSTEIILNLMKTDKILVLRRHNLYWTIVIVGDKVGYILHSELTTPPVQLLAMHKKRK